MIAKRSVQLREKNDKTCLRNSDYLNDNDQEEEKKEQFRFHWLLEEKFS